MTQRQRRGEKRGEEERPRAAVCLVRRLISGEMDFIATFVPSYLHELSEQILIQTHSYLTGNILM